MGEIVIEESDYRAFAMALASLFMLIASIAVLVYGFNREQARYWLPGLLGTVIFFIAFIVAVMKATKEKKLFTITRNGIIDGAGISGFGFISFDDIKEFRIVTLYRTRVIAIVPKDVDRFISKLPATKRRLVKRNVIMDQPPVSVNVEMAKNMEPEDILSLLQKRLKDHNMLYN